METLIVDESFPGLKKTETCWYEIGEIEHQGSLEIKIPLKVRESLSVFGSLSVGESLNVGGRLSVGEWLNVGEAMEVGKWS